MIETKDEFYDNEKGEFNTGDDMKIAHVLGDNIDDPKYTFRLMENLVDKRIELLHQKFFEVKKVSETQKAEFECIEKDIDNVFDNSEQDLYFRIKSLFDEFEKQNNNLNSQNLLLQKYLTQLTKEKMDLLVQINYCMQRLDNLEKFLGISIAAKRMKKTFNKK